MEDGRLGLVWGNVRREVARNVSKESRDARVELSSRLRARREEIENQTLSRVLALSEPGAPDDPDYLDGLRAAMSAALDYGFEVLESGSDSATPVPLILFTQARLAARAGVSLKTVICRYNAGHFLLGSFLAQEARDLLDREELGRLQRTQELAFSRLLDAIVEEHTRELRSRPVTPEEHLAARIERLVNGEFVDISDLRYDIDGYHLAMVAAGTGAGRMTKQLSAGLDARLLLVSRGDVAWAWLGSRQALDPDEVLRHFSKSWPSGMSLALGESEQGPAGWRLSHHQARAAIPIAVRSSKPVVRYADVALLSAALRDEILAGSLRQAFLGPLEHKRDGGILCATLRAYFASGSYVTAAAQTLGISRQTVNSRLRAVEQTIGRRLDECAPELQTVLRLEDLGAPRHSVSVHRRH